MDGEIGPKQTDIEREGGRKEKGEKRYIWMADKKKWEQSASRRDGMEGREGDGDGGHHGLQGDCRPFNNTTILTRLTREIQNFT